MQGVQKVTKNLLSKAIPAQCYLFLLVNIQFRQKKFTKLLNQYITQIYLIGVHIVFVQKKNFILNIN